MFRKAQLKGVIKSTTGERRIYLLSEPLNGYDYVIVIATLPSETFKGVAIPASTKVYGCDEIGNIPYGGVLAKTEEHVYDHAKALSEAGYTILRPIGELIRF